MIKKIITITFCFFIFGCAAPPPQPITILGNPPSYLNLRFMISGGRSTEERLSRAQAECSKLGDIYQASLETLDGEKANPKRTFDRFVCAVKKQSSLTPLQLRALQSRLFKTKTEDLLRAIETFAKDGGGICARFGQNRFLPGGLHVGGNHLLENEIECRSLGKQYNSELTKTDKGIVLRTRIYVWSLSHSSVQITDPKEYTTLFKSIADQLFIEAIQIDPAEMR
jgi:hypothetical protein